MNHLAEANQRLKASKNKATLEDRGGFLYVRATLPDRNGGKPKRQKIALRLRADSPQEVKRAENLARKLGNQLALGEFTWEEWSTQPEATPPPPPDPIAAFNAYYLQKGGSRQSLKEYQKIFKHLPSTLTPETLLETLLAHTEPNTRARQKAIISLHALARHAGIALDLTPYRGHYSPAPREIPSDPTIALHHQTLPSPDWQWAYGVQAAYGLRNHEIFRIEGFRGLALIVGETTKTGHREVLPLFPEWAEQWHLTTPNPPPADLDQDNETLGRLVTKKFKKAGMPFRPYDLRHAWAVRAIGFLLPIDMRARMMGHSVEIHHRVYQRWIRQDEIDRLWRVLVDRPDRPAPPIV